MDIFPTQAQYVNGSNITFTVLGLNHSELRMSVLHNNKEVLHTRSIVSNNGIAIPDSYDLSRGGYLIRFITEQGKVFETAFDVDSGQIRYGFLSDFFDGCESDTAAIDWLNKLHINYVQYYDWMYRHHQLIPPTEVFTDSLGRKLSTRTIHSRIIQAASHGMKSIAYGAIYGAGNDFAHEHQGWRLYDLNHQPIRFFDFLSIMNVNPSCGWHDYIINEYRQAVEFGFDGIHMDTYGFPKTAYSNEGIALNLPEDFGQLIDDTKTSLTNINPSSQLIFNCVGNWPVTAVANRRQEAIYIEVWSPYDTYQSIYEIVVAARRCNTNKQIILAAYLNPFESGPSEEAFNALFILTSIITILGATHLIHGENQGIITEGYYAKYFHNQDQYAATIIRRYYDYIVYFSGLWSDRSLIDVSYTHFRGDNREYTADVDFLSPSPVAGKLWANIRESKQTRFINFVNLISAENSEWNQPKTVHDSEPFTFRILMNRPIERITFSTPDGDQIQVQQLEYEITDSEFGPYAVVRIPSIHLWATLLIASGE